MTTVVTKLSPMSCKDQAYNRLSGAVRVVLANGKLDRGLRLEVLERALDDAERLAAGGDPQYVLNGQHGSSPPGQDGGQP